MTQRAGRDIGIVLIILALAVVARMPGLDKSFQGDEFFSLQDARDLSAIPETLVGDTHPPLYFYLLHFWMKISQSEAFLRILSVIPGLGLCLLAYLIGAETFGKDAGVMGALLIALSPAMVWSSQYVRTYSMASFFTVLSVYLMILLIKRGGKGFGLWAAFVFACTASIYTFYFSALLLIAANIFVFASMRGEKGFLAKWIVSQAAVFVLYIPWLPFFYFQQSSYVGHPQMVQAVGFYVGGVHMGAVIRSLAGLAGFDPRLLARGVMSADFLLKAVSVSGIAIAAAVGVSYAAYRYRKLQGLTPGEKRYLQLFLILAAAPFAMALVLHQAAKVILMSHYFMTSFVFLALSAIVLAGRILSKRADIILLSVLLMLYAGRLVFLYQDREMDFKGAHRYVKAVYGDSMPVVAPSFGGIFEHYFSDQPKRFHMDGLKVLALSDREIAVISYPSKLELQSVQKRFGSFLAMRGYVFADSKSFGDLVVKKYTRS